jgi:phosphoribosylamine--glycine ligase
VREVGALPRGVNATVGESTRPRFTAGGDAQPGCGIHFDDVGGRASSVAGPFDALNSAKRGNAHFNGVSGNPIGEGLQQEPHRGRPSLAIDTRPAITLWRARTAHGGNPESLINSSFSHAPTLASPRHNGWLTHSGGYSGRVRILVLGSGAREHAIITSLLSELTDTGAPAHQITAAPGNAGIAADVETVALDPTKGAIVAHYAADNGIELVVIGPEAPLVAGVADTLRAKGIPVFGPGKAAAALEGSKTFAKRIMDAANVPTGRATRASSAAEAAEAIDEYGAPYVIKADGLAAGKGVLVSPDRDAALAHAAFWLQHGDVLVEEFLDGQEVSLFLLSDGTDVVPLSPAQDYKRALDGDAGPNTGGMGAYSPLPWLPDEFVDDIIDSVALPTIRQLAAEGTPFVGLLYCGLIVTSTGVRVIEFNARFGDPETQVVLPRLETPLAGLLFAAATGTLGTRPYPVFSSDVAVTVVLASEGYPESPVTGRPIFGLDAAAAVEGVTIAHAATAMLEGQFIATGGRVLTVVARGHDFATARSRAYEALGLITLEGSHYRTDIAARVAQ